ncbi:MAG: long-chain fatty acid--CoA ligase [Pseudomonadota bacterium]
MILDDLNALTRHHRAHCKPYADYVQSMFGKDEAEDLSQVPYLPARAFKSFKLQSIPEADVFKTMRSSGTSGAQSTIILDKLTAQRQTRALTASFADHFGKGRFPMLVIDTESTVKDRLSFSARTAGVNGFSLFSRGRAFALNDDLKLDLPRTRAFLEEHAGKPIFVFGFTFLIWTALFEELATSGEKLDLSNAFILHGGGWKKLEDRKVDNATFKARLAETTGCTRVHNYYGMIEQTGTIYIECEEGRLHAGPQSDVIVRDPHTHAVLGPGETGLIQVFSTIQESYPGHSVLTEDMGRVYPGTDCPCGRTGTIVEIEGRLPKAEIRGCSDAYR